MSFNIPLVLFIYRRPIFVKNLIDVLRDLQPNNIYVFADGPKNNFDEDLICKETREQLNQINWNCNLQVFFEEKNIGLRKNITKGLNYIFSHEKAAIILEDDCLPNIDFFYFCQELLVRYENNMEISVVSGNNHQNDKNRGDGSYYFSKYSHCWGWATWASRWKHYNDLIDFWPSWKLTDDWHSLNSCEDEKEYWEEVFNKVYEGEVDSWAYRWLATNWYLNKLTILPNVNLVSNVGFGPDSTHTKSDIVLPAQPTGCIKNITHPKLVVRNLDADFYTYLYHYGGIYKRFPYSMLPILKKIIPIAVKRKIKLCLIKINLYRFLRLR